jgi:hypothetical protein
LTWGTLVGLVVWLQAVVDPVFFSACSSGVLIKTEDLLVGLVAVVVVVVAVSRASVGKGLAPALYQEKEPEQE